MQISEEHQLNCYNVAYCEPYQHIYVRLSQFVKVASRIFKRGKVIKGL
jgi:hypothetical protein